MGGAGTEARGRLSPLIQLFISSRAYDIDAYGVRGFGSAMPENKFSVAAFALHAIPAGCRQVTVASLLHMPVVLL